MPNREHLEILEKGVETWNKWRMEKPQISPDLTDASLSGEDFTGADFNKVNLSSSSLNKAILKGAYLRKANLTEADLSRSNLTEADLSEANLSEANLGRASLIRAILPKANLMSADLSGANLIRANLKGANLHEANLFRAALINANLVEGNFTRANLSWANLTDANLTGADLTGANLIEANLTRTNLNGANLSWAYLTGAYLHEANFHESFIGYTVFSYVDLSEAKGLETLNHESPSTIGIDTIYKSKGKIPAKFLRDAGVPEKFLNYIHTLDDITPIQYYSCYISYCVEDTTVAEQLLEGLQAKGLRAWFFPESAKIGKTVWGEIDQPIKVYDKLIVICSKNSLKSPAVIREIRRALEKEARFLQEHGKVKEILAPIILDDYLIDEWKHPIKADVLKKGVGDFRGCKANTGKYSKAFDKLIDALSAE
jgi:uncharacterized protein YjbI with pentapeptide repeats